MQSKGKIGVDGHGVGPYPVEPPVVRPIDEQTILVTGGTDGLGRRVAGDLAARGATLLLHGRDPVRGEEALWEVQRAGGGRESRLLLADLSSLDDVRGLAAEVARSVPRLDALVNNAGIAPTEERRESADGIELTFAVNYLSHFLLTALLLDLLERSAPARIVNVASIGQQPIDFDDPLLERGYSQFRAYSQSKLAQILFAFELAERLGTDAGVTANALHPATLMNTRMVRESGFGTPRSTVEEGARATGRLVADEALEGVTGRYFDGADDARADTQAYDSEARRRLWDLSEQLTGVQVETS
jgi:NAD(P)-dependent dehydrogenase (short-subunit alcohol dehydrogenase family)